MSAKAALVEGNYRYWLSRAWGDAVTLSGKELPRPYVLWVMLNPSTADASKDDPTIRKCIGFTTRMGFERLVVVNLFAWRATEPRELTQHVDIIGPRNNEFIKSYAADAAVIVCAWGAFDGVDVKTRAWQLQHHLLPQWRLCRVCKGTMSVPVETNDGTYGGKSCAACIEHQGSEPACSALAFTKEGQPRHPLRMPYYAAAELQPWPRESLSFSLKAMSERGAS